MEGWDRDLRPIIKKAFNQLINSKPSSRNENQWHRFAPSMPLETIPEDWAAMNDYQRAEVHRSEFTKTTGREYRELLADLKAFHEPIDEFFFSQSWGWLQRIDSDIAEDVMLKLLEDQHTSLPIHDSFIVRRGAELPLTNAMNEAFERRVGVQCNIVPQEAIYDPPPGYVPEPGGVCIDEFYEDVRADILNCHESNRREAEWKRVWGLWGTE